MSVALCLQTPFLVFFSLYGDFVYFSAGGKTRPICMNGDALLSISSHFFLMQEITAVYNNLPVFTCSRHHSKPQTSSGVF